MFYMHIWNEKDQNLNFFIPLVAKIWAHCYASLALVGRGVVKWRPHWQAFPFSCLPVDMLKLKVRELFDNILVVFFHFVAIIDNSGNNRWKLIHVEKLQLALMEEDSKIYSTEWDRARLLWPDLWIHTNKYVLFICVVSIFVDESPGQLALPE